MKFSASYHMPPEYAPDKTTQQANILLEALHQHIKHGYSNASKALVHIVSGREYMRGELYDLPPEIDINPIYDERIGNAAMIYVKRLYYPDTEKYNHLEHDRETGLRYEDMTDLEVDSSGFPAMYMKDEQLGDGFGIIPPELMN